MAAPRNMRAFKQWIIALFTCSFVTSFLSLLALRRPVSSLPTAAQSSVHPECTLCTLPGLCTSSSEVLSFPVSSLNNLRNIADNKQCGLRNTATGITLFNHQVSTYRHPPARVRPRILLTPESLDGLRRSSVGNIRRHHIPHYLELAVIPLLHTLAILDPPSGAVALESRHTSWSAGIHDALSATFPSISQQPSPKAATCFRAAAYARCRRALANVTVPFQRLISERIKMATSEGLNVAILSRHGTRELLKTHKIAQVVEEVLGAFGHRVHTEERTFENAPFSAQLGFMVNADVLIASHGAGNANVLFMHPGAIFVEVIPFGLQADFSRLAKQAGLIYRSVVAIPDNERVLMCARRMRKKDIQFPGEWRKCISVGRDDCRVDGSMERRTCLRTQRLEVRISELRVVLRDTVNIQGKLKNATIAF